MSKVRLRNDPSALLQTMLEIESLSGKEHRLALFLVKTMNEFGMEAYIDAAGNAVGIKEGPQPKGENDLVLLGHMDTVPGLVDVRREGDLLFGRGAVDAKGPLAAFVLAARELEPPPGARIVVVGAVEEESTTSRGARHAVDCFKPTACIVGEPSGWEGVTLGYKGRLLAFVSCEQEVEHTAGPGSSAPAVLVSWWNRLKAYADDFNKGANALFDSLLPSLRNFGRECDGLMERAFIEVALRLPPGIEMTGLQEHLHSLDPSLEFSFRGCEPAYEGDRSSHLARSFISAIREQGARPRLKYKTGTSDMNVVGPRWRCPILAYGPGDSRLDHTPQEHISIKEFLKGVEVLKAAIQNALS